MTESNRKTQQRFHPWSTSQFQNQSLSSLPSVNTVTDYAESNKFTRKAQFSNLFDMYESEITRLEDQVYKLVREINNQRQVAFKYLSFII